MNEIWLLRFAHTKKRQKYRNVQSHPQAAMSVSDPDNPYRYLEVRGVVERIEPDSTASLFLRISQRYSGDEPPPDAPPRGEAPSDAPDGVVIGRLLPLQLRSVINRARSVTQ
jgi:hypothetical protein